MLEHNGVLVRRSCETTKMLQKASLVWEETGVQKESLNDVRERK